MELGIVADELNKHFREAVRIGTKLGLSRYEIRFLQTGRVPVCDANELLEIEQIIKNENVTITTLSPGLFKWTADEKAFRVEMSEVFPRAVELAKRWNLDSLIVFGFKKPNATEQSFYPNEQTPNYIFEWFAEVAEATEKAGITLMIEPEPICWMDTGTKMAELINKVNSDKIRVNYDPANVAWLTGKDPIDEFDLIAPFIANVHIKNIKLTLPIWAIPSEGIIDYTKHFSALKKINYSGNISLEPHLDNSFETTLLCKLAVEKLWENSG